ncbi:Glycoside hydrolase, family 76 [Pleurostoma richardsiae]|uniref:Glycoside hydrolase, family 76 n=1 Tax=Pleurostoma richardsiae TaxID=41990 RepID=A0AA38S9U6_9PEZI|nr:Glycoside hydrolase, family 76 [Pleurostoma richardsiae]
MYGIFGFLALFIGLLGGVGVSASASFLPFQTNDKHAARPRSAIPDFEILDQALDALRVMQDDYFAPWLGTWPTSIDWTGAVIATHVAAALSSLSEGLELLRLGGGAEDYVAKENLISLYFSQILSYYFGQDAFAIRNEAYDDILWVVLGWLETIEFIDLHTKLHYPVHSSDYYRPGQGISEVLHNQTWHGNIWIPAFSHRARIFWDLADKGWDTVLCGGGMTWNPRLEPYKNAITNELFIAASASMYLYFPGDSNAAPFGAPPSNQSDPGAQAGTGPTSPHNPLHLGAAVAGYTWLATSGMMNSAGLYVDGFHISGWSNISNPNTKCDVRNNMVYTYNQGVILTGQIDLWKVTGDATYLRDGHRLIQAVIRATGYDLWRDRPLDTVSDLDAGRLPRWRGLGRAGVLEEQCDVTGDCSQNGQTFKGIFFHHFTTFCAPVDPLPAAAASAAADAEAHHEACAAYVGWIRHNAAAALATRDSNGKFGMWWTAGLLRNVSYALTDRPDGSSPGAVDYRNHGVPQNGLWVPGAAVPKGPVRVPEAPYGDVVEQKPVSGPTKHAPMGRRLGGERTQWTSGNGRDPNSRGRGRTVETQGSGLALLRALWEMTNRYQR